MWRFIGIAYNKQSKYLQGRSIHEKSLLTFKKVTLTLKKATLTIWESNIEFSRRVLYPCVKKSCYCMRIIHAPSRDMCIIFSAQFPYFTNHILDWSFWKVPTPTCTFPVFKKFSTFSTFRMLKTRLKNKLSTLYVLKMLEISVFLGCFADFQMLKTCAFSVFMRKILFSNFAVSADFQHTKFVEFVIFPSFQHFSADFLGDTFKKTRSIFFLHFGKNIHFPGFLRFGLSQQSVGSSKINLF